MSTFKSALTALTLLASVAALKTNNTEHSNCTEQNPAPSIKPLRKWDWLQTSYHGALQQQAAGEKNIQGRECGVYQYMSVLLMYGACSHAGLRCRKLASA